MIEISDKKYWIKCTFEDAKSYCFWLDIDGKKGWNLIPSNRMYIELSKQFPLPTGAWVLEDEFAAISSEPNQYLAVPVREIDD